MLEVRLHQIVKLDETKILDMTEESISIEKEKGVSLRKRWIIVFSVRKVSTHRIEEILWVSESSRLYYRKEKV